MFNDVPQFSVKFGVVARRCSDNTSGGHAATSPTPALYKFSEILSIDSGTCKWTLSRQNKRSNG